MALAASVLLGNCGLWAGQGSLKNDPGFAGVALAVEALTTGEETRLPDGSTARVLASYQTDLGLCRMVAHDDWRHVACRNDQAESWELALSIHSDEADSYLPSSALPVELIDRLLDEIGAGAALDPEAEGRALEQ